MHKGADEIEADFMHDTGHRCPAFPQSARTNQ
jgi:hypothetical protein